MARNFSLTVFILGICLSRFGVADDSPAFPAATPEQVTQAIERSIGYMQRESAAWLNSRKCAACHHVPMVLWSLSEAETQGYTIDKKFLADTTESTIGSREKMMASKLVSNPADPPDPRPLARGVNMGQVFMAVAAQSLPKLEEGQQSNLSEIVDEIVKKQQGDGSWEFFLSRPPVNESQTSDTAWIILALQGRPGTEAPESHRVALEKGMSWLADTKLPVSYQDKVLKILLATRTGKPRDELQTAIGELLALQRPDGGWNQIPEGMSDAFATGQTLYVLALAGCTAEQPEIKRAIDYLIATQKPDGSWSMTSRSSPDGKPGSAKLLTPITCAASAWATLGLSRVVPMSR